MEKHQAPVFGHVKLNRSKVLAFSSATSGISKGAPNVSSLSCGITNNALLTTELRVSQEKQHLQQASRKSSRQICSNTKLKHESCNLSEGIKARHIKLGDRLASSGHSSMLDSELLELLLYDAVEDDCLKTLVTKLINSFHCLNGVLAAPFTSLARIDSFNQEAFLKLRIVEAFATRMAQSKILEKEVLSSWNELVSYCRVTMAYRNTEQFRVFYLDKQNAVISDEEQPAGTIDHVPVYPREIVKRALELNASALILAHNHPSGNPMPSEEDIYMTKKVVSACDVFGISIHDHIIIGKGSEFSFRSNGFV